MYRRLITIAAVLLVVPIIVAVGAPGAVADDHTTTTRDRPIDIETDRASIYLRTVRTEVGPGEQAVLEFSATNYVTNSRNMTVQLILQTPSGVSVSGSAAAESGVGQFVTVDTIEPGESRGFRVYVEPNNEGRYKVVGEAVYYYGSDREDGTGERAMITVVREPPTPSAPDRVARSAGSLLTLPLSVLEHVTGSLPRGEVTLVCSEYSDACLSIPVEPFVGWVLALVPSTALGAVGAMGDPDEDAGDLTAAFWILIFPPLIGIALLMNFFGVLYAAVAVVSLVLVLGGVALIILGTILG
jgi:hypothetical protein